VFTHKCDTGKPLCIDSVLKHCAANRKRLFQRCQIRSIYIRR